MEVRLRVVGTVYPSRKESTVLIVRIAFDALWVKLRALYIPVGVHMILCPFFFKRTPVLTFFDWFQFSELEVTLAGPDQLTPKPDVDRLEFGKYFTDHMLKVHYHNTLNGWQKPEIRPIENLSLHPAAKVLHYAVEVNKCLRIVIISDIEG